MLVHGLFPSFGVKLQSTLGMFKVAVLAIVIGSGMIGLVTGSLDSDTRYRNFENIWEGTTRSPTEVCLALFSAFWGFVGFNQVNYALGEVKSPKRTLRIAGPLGVILVACLYLAANLAYFVAVPKEDIKGSSGQLVAALLFQNVYGTGKMESVLDGFVAMSAMGNVLSVVSSFLKSIWLTSWTRRIRRCTVRP